MAKISKKNPESNHVIMLIHGPEERLEVYLNYNRAPDSLMKLTSAFQKWFPQWKAKQGPGVLRYKCSHFGLDDEVRKVSIRKGSLLLMYILYMDVREYDPSTVF